jgi:dihydroorotase
MKTILIKQANVINEGQIKALDVLIKGGRIEKIAPSISVKHLSHELPADGKYLMPGIIDDQVHFREPGLTHKANIYSESKAAVAGGVTSFMEMPNTQPAAVTAELLEQKYAIASQTSLANYSFYLGTSNTNLDEIKRVNKNTVCGIKIFMGSSTGNLVIDNHNSLEDIFRYAPILIATHCETDAMVKSEADKYRLQYGDAVPMKYHPKIRNERNCLNSSILAIELAKQHHSRLHILHISTKDEIELFRNDIPLKDKRITAEVCVHHLFFDSKDYEKLGGLIKCNPAIKGPEHKPELLRALIEDRFDVIASDHAPHTWQEKHATTTDGKPDYFKIPAGLPLVQHPLLLMLSLYHQGSISLETIVQKMCHNVADCFQVVERGYIREGYFADMVLFDLNRENKITRSNIYYKCGWSPLEGYTFKGAVDSVLVNGNLVYHDGIFDEAVNGLRLLFNRT